MDQLGSVSHLVAERTEGGAKSAVGLHSLDSVGFQIAFDDRHLLRVLRPGEDVLLLLWAVREYLIDRSHRSTQEARGDLEHLGLVLSKPLEERNRIVVYEQAGEEHPANIRVTEEEADFADVEPQSLEDSRDKDEIGRELLDQLGAAIEVMQCPIESARLAPACIDIEIAENA